jgi:hypothetical protein
MHPDLAELLSLRDRPLSGDDAPASAAALHVSGCAPCRLEFERLQRLRVAMRNAPAPLGAERSPEHGWSAVGARLGQRQRQPAWPRPGWRMAGGLAGALMIAVGLAFFSGRTAHREELTQAVVSTGAADSVPAVDQVAALMAESQRLESLLARLPSEPTVARAGTVFTAAGLEDRIEWIDYALGERSVRQADSAHAQPLWQQRVDLLNSLVAVRYAQARTVSLSY